MKSTTVARAFRMKIAAHIEAASIAHLIANHTNHGTRPRRNPTRSESKNRTHKRKS
jgi:hypothetical protein